MKLNVCFQPMSLLALLVLVGVVTPIQAQESEMPTTTAQCSALFGSDIDEFDDIELTDQQERKIADLEESWDTQFDQVLTPEQRQIFETAEQRFEAGLENILTPEQQSLAENDELDEVTLSPEQQAQLERLDEQFWNESDFLLTADQEARLEDYERNYEEQLENILTAQQQTQFERNQFALDFPEFSGLQLTPAQRQQVVKFTDEFEQKEAAIIPEITSQQDVQLTQLEERYEERLFQILSPGQQQIWDQSDDQALNLTADQEAELEALDQEFESMVVAIVPDLSADNIAKLEQLEQDYENQLNTVLNPSQQQQLEENFMMLESCF